MAVTTLRQMRQMPHTEIEDFFIYIFQNIHIRYTKIIFVQFRGNIFSL